MIIDKEIERLSLMMCRFEKLTSARGYKTLFVVMKA